MASWPLGVNWCELAYGTTYGDLADSELDSGERCAEDLIAQVSRRDFWCSGNEHVSERRELLTANACGVYEVLP